MPNDVRERIKSISDICAIQSFNEKTRSYELCLSDESITKILSVIGAEIEGMKEIYPHEETCRCKECVGVYYKNKTLTDLRARLENKNGM